MNIDTTPSRIGVAPRRARATLLGLVGLAELLVLAHGSAHGGQARAITSAVHTRAGYDWLQFDGGPQHSGDNTRETTLTPATVARLRPLFTVTLPGIADGAPVLLRAVPTAHGTRDLLFLTTTDGHLVARDARTGAAVWAHQYGPGACRINNVGGPCYTTSSPAIDPDRRYVYSYGLDGKVHKYAVGSGDEVRRGGWPETITLKGYNEKESPALAIATAKDGHSYLYASNGGYPGDQGDYQGHVTIIDLASGAQRVFNTDCSNRAVHFAEAPGTPDCPTVRGAVWARPTVVYDAATDRIYLGVGRGTFDPARHDWADSILALHPDGTGVAGGPLDSYTPANYLQLDAEDHDLGSTSPALLPVPPTSRVRRLAAQAGKDGLLRLLDLDNLSGQGSPGHTGGEVQVLPVPQGGTTLPTPAVWVNPRDGSAWLFLANYQGISGLRLTVDGGLPRLHPMWTDAVGDRTSPLVAGGVLYVAGGTTLQALDPMTGRAWWGTTIGGIHWASPLVANGVLYMADGDAALHAYSLAGR